MNQVFFNILPPEDILCPNLTFSQGISDLQAHNISAGTIYWNILFDRLITNFIGADTLNKAQKLYPFIPLLGKNKIEYNPDELYIELLALCPENIFKHTSYYQDRIYEYKRIIPATIRSVLTHYDLSETGFMGFSMVDHQWLPALQIAGIVQKDYPHIKTFICNDGNNQHLADLLTGKGYFGFSVDDPVSFLKAKYQAEESNTHNEQESFKGVPGNSMNPQIVTETYKKQLTCTDPETAIYPDFKDFFLTNLLKHFISGVQNKIQIPVKSGEDNLAVSAKEINHNTVKKIQYYAEKYSVRKFTLLTNYGVPKLRGSLDDLLQRLANMQESEENKIEITIAADCVGFTEDIFAKLYKGGIRNIYSPFEAMTNTLLRKINPQLKFNDFLLCVKFASKYSIKLLNTRLFLSKYSEKECDIEEASRNLHLMRFYLGERGNRTSIQLEDFHAATCNQDTPKQFETAIEITSDNLAYTNSGITIIAENSKLSLQINSSTNLSRWRIYTTAYDFYIANTSSYSVIQIDGSFLFNEYLNQELIATHWLLPEMWHILTVANKEVKKKTDVLTKLRVVYPGLKTAEYIAMEEKLVHASLLSVDPESDEVFSVIDTSQFN